MRIGVTGGAGYIAAHVVQDLLESGHQVVAIDNMSTGNPRNIFTGTPGYEFMEGDTRRDEDLRRFFERDPEIVFHFAASKAAGESMADPRKYSDNNVRGGFRLLEYLAQSNCRRFVFSSSAAVYGSPRYLPLDEKHPLAPDNYYGFTKKVTEDNLIWLSRLKNIRFAALRYFNAAGYDVRGRVPGLENEPNNLLPIIMEVAVGIRPELAVFGTDYDTPDGTCIRDYIHVNDLSRAHIMAMNYIMEKDQDLIVNLGSQSGLSVKEMLAAAREITGRPIPHRDAERRPGDPAKLIASAGKAREKLGWSTAHSDVKTLIESTWRVYRSNHSIK